MTLLKEIAHEEREKLKILHHETREAKFKAEEVYQMERSGFRASSKLTSWIPQYVQSDIKQIRKGIVPIHMEVVARITVSSFLAYVLALGNFPNVIPESQRVLIAMLGSTLGMLFPTLMFSIGLIMFPSMIFVTLLGLVLATMLLACATVSLGFYTAMFGFCALVISHMRFDKKTGGMTCFLVIEMALNSQPLARAVADDGMDLVKSLWTERGVRNERALYTNTLVGMMWIIFVMIVGRILPPFRTVRSGIVTGLIPASLKDVADSIDLDADDLQLRLQSQGKDSGDKVDAKAPEGYNADPEDQKKRHEQLLAKLIHEKSVLTNGTIASMTAFEPRMHRFSPPECSWMALKALCIAVDRTVLASLALDEAYRSPKELSLDMEQQLMPSFVAAAATLRKCANAVVSNSTVAIDDLEGSPMDGHTMTMDQSPVVVATPDEEGDAKIPATRIKMKSVGGVADEEGVEVEAEETKEEEAEAESPPTTNMLLSHTTKGNEPGSGVDPDSECKEGTRGAPEASSQDELDDFAVDPIFFKNVCQEVVKTTNDWVSVAGPPDRTKPFFDKRARKAMKENIVPWFKGSVWYFVALYRSLRAGVSPSTWRRTICPPYHDADKAAWCINFTFGFTILVAMGVFWDEFRALDNESWFLIAYAFSTTQTAEGTTKKGILRLLGTGAGGFSGWLALTACGEDGSSIYGLIAWLTVFTAVAAYFGLPRGFKARMGLSPDYGFLPSYFVMTQALVVAQVYVGEADKKTITLNRIVTNVIGIAMAIVLALIPPALYGGNPKFANDVLEEEKSLLVQCLNLLLSHTQSTDENFATSTANISEEMQTIKAERTQKISKLIEEADDFYSDSAKLRSFHLLKVDPKLKECLDKLQVIASWIFVSIGYAVHSLNNKNLGDKFLEDPESRTQLQKMLKELESGSGDVELEKLSLQDEEGGISDAARSRIFINCAVTSIKKLQKVHDELQTIKYGLCS